MSTRIVREGKVEEPPIDGEWLRISGAVIAEMPILSGRDDVIAMVRPAFKNAEGKSLDPAPASFHIPTATVTVDGWYLKDEDGTEIPPEKVFPERFSNRLEYPGLWGAVIHEAAHAAHTGWLELLPADGTLPEDVPRRALDAAILMEEPRIERKQLEERGGDRSWLRACTKQIVMDEKGAPTQKGAVAKSMILIGGRVLAGVIDESEAQSIFELAEAAFGTETFEEMKAILQEAICTEDEDMEGMLALGARWHKLLGDDDGTNGEAGGLFGEGDGAPGPGGAADFPLPGDVLDAIAGITGAMAANDNEDYRDPKKEAERKAEAKARADAAKAAAGTFKSASHGFSAGGGGGIYSYRSPTVAERGGAALLARALRRAVIRERSTVVRTSARPPGRLSMRAAVSYKAAVAARQIPDAEPFSRKVRKHNPSPPLRVGIGQDVSGSQGPYVGPAAIAGWTVARAVSLIPEAQTAMVTFGSSVRPVVWPRQAPPGVPVLTASDGYEMPSTAIKALDGALNLTQPGYARLLFMATDAEFVHATEASHAVTDVERLLASGCKVIWLATGTGFSGSFRQHALLVPGVIRIDVSGTPDNIGKIIAEAVVRALKE